ncbi:MAG: PAS domain-containing protein [Cyclobacteriaceae bacterium]
MYEKQDYANMLKEQQQFLISPLIAWEFIQEYKVDKQNNWFQDFFSLRNMSLKNGWKINYSYIKNVLKSGKQAVVFTDLKQRFIYASQFFEEMTGFKRESVMGKTPRLFQGPATDTEELKKLGKLISENQPASAILDNYKKDGTLYKCKIDITPIYNQQEKVVSYMGIEEEYH